MPLLVLQECDFGYRNFVHVDFPSLKSQRLLAVLGRKPLSYEVVRQKGSHRRMESGNGYPPLGFAWHDGVTIGGRAVKKVLVDDVGLSEEEALQAIQGKLR